MHQVSSKFIPDLLRFSQTLETKFLVQTSISQANASKIKAFISKFKLDH